MDKTKSPSGPWRPALAFAVRTWASGMLALFIAFELQMDSPTWAPVTAWIVCQPTAGMAISKSVYRLIGTVIGVIMGVLLVAFFDQSPELFILALSLWVGGCTVASNVLRNFRAYGAMLAGYTAPIIALAAYDHPNQVFDLAMARGSCIIIGIMSAVFVTTLFSPHRAKKHVLHKLHETLAETAQRVAFPHGTPLAVRLGPGKKAVADLIALDAEIDFAAAEAAEFRIHANGARSLIAHLFAAISAKRSLEDRLERAHSLVSAPLQELLTAAKAFFDSAPPRIMAGELPGLSEELKALSERLRQLQLATDGPVDARTVTDRVVADRLDDLLRHFRAAVDDLHMIKGHYAWKPSLKLNFHQDHRLAWINGIRAFLAVWVAGAFWIASAWPSGAAMLILICMVCSLFSALPYPDKQGLGFLYGMALAIAGAFVCEFFILPHLVGFGLLALTLGLFLIPGTMLIPHPKISGLGFAYTVFFLNSCRLLNGMVYDVTFFLNNAVASLTAVILCIMAYRLFMPPSPYAARCYVTYRIRRGLEIIAAYRTIPPPWAWQTRMFDRISRLATPDNPSATLASEWYEGGLAALNLGNELLRLRLLMAEGKLDEPMLDSSQDVLEAFGHIGRRPAVAARMVEVARKRLETKPPEGNSERWLAWVRLRGIYEEMQAFFHEHPGFLTPANTVHTS